MQAAAEQWGQEGTQRGLWDTDWKDSVGTVTADRVWAFSSPLEHFPAGKGQAALHLSPQWQRTTVSMLITVALETDPETRIQVQVDYLCSFPIDINKRSGHVRQGRERGCAPGLYRCG